jgi:hypothetical protein
MAGHSPSDLYLSVVSVHEQMLGANKYIAQARTRSSVIRGYQMIESAILDYTNSTLFRLMNRLRSSLTSFASWGYGLARWICELQRLPCLTHLQSSRAIQSTLRKFRSCMSRIGQRRHRFTRYKIAGREDGETHIYCGQFGDMAESSLRMNRWISGVVTCDRGR